MHRVGWIVAWAACGRPANHPLDETAPIDAAVAPIDVASPTDEHLRLPTAVIAGDTHVV